MKKYSKLIFALIGFLGMISCTQEKEQVVLESDNIAAATITAPVSGSEIVLDRDLSSEEAVTFTWDAAEYGLDLSVNYELQAVVKGESFESPISLASTQETSVVMTTADLNSKLLSGGLMPEEANDIETRVVAKVSDYVEPAISSNIDLTVTPFATEFPPIYMIGASTGGWDPSLAVEVLSTGEPFEYSTIWEFIGGETFRFFAQPNWGSEMGVDQWNYPWFIDNGGSVSDLLSNADDGDKNFKLEGTTGYYEITVNIKSNTVDMVTAPRPMAFLTGDAITQTGWGWDNPSELAFLKKDVFIGEVEFTKDGAFRIFMQADWGPVNYGYDVVTVYNDLITPALDHGDPNWYFVGESGVYNVRLDLSKVESGEGEITITPKS